MRRCLACRRREAKPRLVRLALVDGTVQVDPSARRPGRGAYLCSSACLETALRRDGAPIARALRLGRAEVRLDAEGLRGQWRAQAAADAREARPAGHDGATAAPSGGVAE